MNTISALSEPARSVWAKSLDENGGWLPLWQHMDDAADVAAYLFDRWLAPAVVRTLSHDFGGDADAARAAVSLLTGLHDLGKSTPAFAIQDTVLADRMRRRGLYMPTTKAELPDRQLCHHSLAGHHLLIAWLMEQGWSKPIARSWGVVIGGHHGVPPDAQQELSARPVEVPYLYGADAWDRARSELALRVSLRTGAASRLTDWSGLLLSQQFQVLATAVVIISDWIASNVELFPFYQEDAPEQRENRDRVNTALARLRLPAPWRPGPVPESAKELFQTRFRLPPGANPRPVQEVVLQVAREVSRPGILVVEAPMGEGKTEAALGAAEALAARTGAGGLLVALPTQATSDAMFTRVLGWLDRLGEEGQAVATSVTLSHGKARFNRAFRGLLVAGRLRDIGQDENDGRNGSRQGPHSVVAHSWLSGRKKAQLASFSVATIDQLLFAGLKARHLVLRHLGLAGKVVIIDEIHAYDAYMNSYLLKVLTWLGAYQVPVVALSATLPGQRRRELVGAYQAGWLQATGELPGNQALAVELADAYPVITWTDAGRMYQRTAAPSGRGTRVHLDWQPDNLEALVAVLREALAEGGTALVVRNTVRRVLETGARLERAFPGEVSIAHSRFIVADRMRNDAQLLDRFGPPGRAVTRPRRHIVVGSQVVEQSLDVDFDLLVTDLAPVDLVLQRLGRLHRHDRGEGQGDRPERVRAARAYVAGTDFAVSPPALEPVAARYVYSRYVLLRAAAVLLPRFGQSVDLPADIAPLVQAAYGEYDLGPPDWQEAMAAAREAWLEVTGRKEDKARPFQVADPAKPGKPLVGWLAADAGETDDSAQGQGQVRDGAPSLEAILVQRRTDGEWHTPGWLDETQANLSIARDQAPPESLAAVLAQCALRLPLEFSEAKYEEELWRATPPTWESSPLVYHLPVLIVNDDGSGSLGDRSIRYTPDRGLEVLSDDE